MLLNRTVKHFLMVITGPVHTWHLSLSQISNFDDETAQLTPDRLHPSIWVKGLLPEHVQPIEFFYLTTKNFKVFRDFSSLSFGASTTPHWTSFCYHSSLSVHLWVFLHSLNEFGGAQLSSALCFIRGICSSSASQQQDWTIGLLVDICLNFWIEQTDLKKSMFGWAVLCINTGGCVCSTLTMFSLKLQYEFGIILS